MSDSCEVAPAPFSWPLASEVACSEPVSPAAEEDEFYWVDLIGLAVVNRDGETLVSLRGDGTGPHTVENARRKAYTANTFKMSTQDFIDAMKTQPTRREQTTLPSVIAINGGVPIKVGNEVIGGVGLSGSPGKDEECVKAGLEKVKGQLQ